ARAARGLDADMPPLLAAFGAAGVHAEIVDWDEPKADWARFDAALLRSAWDYTERLGEFLAWVERVASLTMLLNPPPVVRWNADKHYLLELARSGLPVVASSFAEPGADPAAASSATPFARVRCCPSGHPRPGRCSHLRRSPCARRARTSSPPRSGCWRRCLSAHCCMRAWI